MKKINFKQLEIFLDIQKQASTVQDVSVQVGNLIYTNTYGLAGHLLAHRIAETNGEVELSDKEAKEIGSLVAAACAPPLIDAILTKLSLSVEDVASRDSEVDG